MYILYPQFHIFLTNFKKDNALGNNNLHFSLVEGLLTFSGLSLGWIVGRCSSVL